MDTSSTIRVRELDLNMISPSIPSDQNGTKLIVIGAPNSGKSYLIKSLLYNKHRIIPTGMVCCSTEDTAKNKYSDFFPDTLVHEKLDTDRIQDFITRQKYAIQYLKNPWAVLVLDDCVDDPKVINTELFQAIFKMGRHWRMFFILGLQYSLDVRPSIRTSVTGTFIFREPNLKNRHKLYENFASIVPDFKMFCDLMDQITGDNHALYIHSSSQSNDWTECVFWYKAKPIPKDWKFGNKDSWEFHNKRYNPSYTPSVFGSALGDGRKSPRRK